MKKFVVKSLFALAFVSTVSLSARGGSSFAGGMAGGMFGSMMGSAMTAPRTQPASPASGITVADFMNLRDNISRDMQQFAERVDRELKRIQDRIDHLEKEIRNLK